jgi:hypothetical protein
MFFLGVSLINPSRLVILQVSSHFFPKFDPYKK